jgi:hypothetical protein
MNTLAREDGKHLGPAAKGQAKGTETGGMTDLQDELVDEDHDSNKGRG